MSKVIVIPTYNERQNLPLVVEGIFALGIPDLRVMVVDDNSPDGTGVVAEKLAQKYPVSVMHREKKQGIGAAYVCAFKKILALPEKQECVIQMDADMSHDPALIPQMLASIKTCDLVLGSRYIAGGGIKNWDPLRRLVSRFGNVYARFVLWLPYRDLTGGYKCFRPEVLEAIDLDSLSSRGYNFQIETTFKAHQKGFRIIEIPIVFTERKFGVSKFNLPIILESFIKVFWLRLHG
ncbi:MAG: polyprenol monophosphomannose synthase [Candidatus Sungbacteria bacterium]|nr:polyprenol monophosphomannose synthase [Candidatus Sungbacteria bacterium]